MNKNLWISDLIMIAGSLYITNLPHQVLGEHKICDGMKLKETPRASFSLNFNSQNSLRHVEGPLKIGVVAAFERLLTEHPG